MTLNFKPDPERQEYFMVAGELIFRRKDDETPHVMKLNTVIMSKDGRIAVAQLGRAQQGLQMEFHRRMQDPELEVIDVVLLNLMRLGQFTPEEFNAAPPGMKLQERGVQGNA